MQMTTVFDGLLPASLNPGVDLGEPVVVWTPTRDGIYFVTAQAIEEDGAPVGFNPTVNVDLDNAGGPTVDPIIAAGAIVDQFENILDMPGVAALATRRGAPVRVVVRVGAIAYADGVTPGETSIVPLDELKLALGLDVDDTTDDLLLTLLEQQAAAFVESQTARRWSAPIDRTEFVRGLGAETLWLGGNVAGDPAAIVSVRSRALNSPEFVDVDESEYIVRGNTLLSTGGRWSHLYEYEVVYSDGYELGSAPADIRALVIDLVGVAFAGLGEEGVKSETIGDYSYTLDSAVTAAASSMSDVSSATLNRYRRVSI